MLSDFHVHTTHCDGKSTAEQTVLKAIEKGLVSIGFSGHGTTPFDMRYCMKDMQAYIEEINSLKIKYSDKIQIYLGVEEDMFSPVDRNNFDYIIGSKHYLKIDGEYYPVDSGSDRLLKCINALDGDCEAFAELYFSEFAEYILSRRPDIVGHYDLMTKYEETDTDLFLKNEKYFAIAEKYLNRILTADCIIEVNTGAIARGLRTAPYPHERLLRAIHKNNGKIILSSDCHHADNLMFDFENTVYLLKNIGFKKAYTIQNSKFVSYEL